MKKTLLILLFLGFLFGENLYSQTVSMIFTWTNTNTVPVNFNIFEVKAPPDTSTILSMFRRDIPNCTAGCTYLYQYGGTTDNKWHYYRMIAWALENGNTSIMSNTAKVFLSAPLKTPLYFKIIIQ